ncbi:MAG: hypothetical protein ACRDRO_27435 [Pseudonocardiaceae bacterium]
MRPLGAHPLQNTPTGTMPDVALYRCAGPVTTPPTELVRLA